MLDGLYWYSEFFPLETASKDLQDLYPLLLDRFVRASAVGRVRYFYELLLSAHMDDLHPRPVLHLFFCASMVNHTSTQRLGSKEGPSQEEPYRACHVKPPSIYQDTSKLISS
jgi:hypothetical protein